MKTASFLNTVKVIFPFLIAILLIALPTYIVAKQPQSYNPLTQVLFDLLLLAASVWFGITFSSKEARKNATDRWLPAAETACNELLTMSATADRMYLKQAKVCKSIEPLFSDIPLDNLAPVIKHVVKMHCEDCADNLENLKNHIENSFRNWEVFINNNCDVGECEYIHERLNERKETLTTSLYKDFSEVASQCTTYRDSA